MVGLAVALRQLGLQVRLACNPAMHPLARSAGFEPIAFGASLGLEQAAKMPLAWDQWLAPPSSMQWSEECGASLLCEAEELLDVLRPGDVLIAPRNLPFLSLIATARGCRWVQVGLNSGAMIDHAQLGTRLLGRHPWKLGMDRLERMLRERLLGVSDGRDDSPPLMRLHAVPEVFVPYDYPQLPSKCTGFWCWDDPRWQQWSPPDDLNSFLKRNPEPLALAFSSQPLREPVAVLRQHLEVAERLGTTLMVVKGWAFSSQELPTTLINNPALHLVESLPFSWLLPRLHTVFIHGGMGTLAQALRAGCRVVIEPFGNDQFLNARLALEQGLALAVHPHRFDPTEVATAVRMQEPPTRRLEEDSFAGIDKAARHLCNVLSQCC